MKIQGIILGIVFGLISLCGFGQDDINQKTIFNPTGDKDKTIDFGFAGTVRLGYADIDDRSTFNIGADFGAIFNHSFEVGVFADGMITDFEKDKILNDDYQYESCVGGIYIMPVFLHNSPIHFSIPLRFGIGELSYTSKSHNHGDYHYHYDFYSEDECTIFTFEPGFNIELNVTKHFHISLGVSHRWNNNVKLKYSDNDTKIIDKKGLDGMFYTLDLRFGIF